MYDAIEGISRHPDKARDLSTPNLPANTNNTTNNSNRNSNSNSNGNSNRNSKSNSNSISNGATHRESPTPEVKCNTFEELK